MNTYKIDKGEFDFVLKQDYAENCNVLLMTDKEGASFIFYPQMAFEHTKNRIKTLTIASKSICDENYLLENEVERLKLKVHELTGSRAN